MARFHMALENTDFLISCTILQYALCVYMYGCACTMTCMCAYLCNMLCIFAYNMAVPALCYMCLCLHLYSRRPKRPRLRWHSFTKSHQISLNGCDLPISNLSAGQLAVLRKLSLLKVTAALEKYSPANRANWSW